MKLWLSCVSRLRATALVLAFTASVVLPQSVAADSGTGTVTVSGTDVAKLTVSISSTNAAFGSSLTPDGAAVGGAISATSVGTTGNQGVYYVWTPPTTPLITVKSNKVWNGTVYASENAGGGASATLTVASGALRWGTSAPTTYADGASLTAFSTVTTTVWLSNVAKGVSTYQQYYGMRVDWNDDPGTFASTVTYSATQ